MLRVQQGTEYLYTNRDILKRNKETQRAGSVAQVTEWPPSKEEALNSNPSTAKKKKRNNVIHSLTNYCTKCSRYN
jgi:hypothetical protein